MRQISYLRVLLLTLAALLLTIVPLPSWLNIGRPDWLLLLVIYWSLNAPLLAGQGYAFVCGFVLDALIGTLLGQHALAFVLVATVAQHFQLRIRVFPLVQQAFAVLLLVALYHFVLFWIDGIVGSTPFYWVRWLPAVVGAVIWPLLVAVIDSSHRR